jgi:hypothetical protein
VHVALDRCCCDVPQLWAGRDDAQPLCATWLLLVSAGGLGSVCLVPGLAVLRFATVGVVCCILTLCPVAGCEVQLTFHAVLLCCVVLVHVRPPDTALAPRSHLRGGASPRLPVIGVIGVTGSCPEASKYNKKGDRGRTVHLSTAFACLTASLIITTTTTTLLGQRLA